MLQKSRSDWEGLAAQFAAEGIGGLAIDLRGHGESPGSPQDYAGMVQDVRAARRFLSARAEVTPGAHRDRRRVDWRVTRGAGGG